MLILQRKLQLTRLLISVSMSIVCFINCAHARDISAEQRAASNARDHYNETKSNDAALTKQIADQEQRVAAEQARLTELQNKQSANKAAYESAKADLDAKSECARKSVA